MSELLSENEIDALMNGVVGGSGHGGMDIREEDYSPYDLTSGMSRVQGWTQYVEIVDDHIQAGLSTRFLGILHKSVEIKRGEIQIQKYGDFATTLKLPTAISCFTLSEIRGLSAIVLDSELVSALVNVFFGGGSRSTPIEGREFSLTEKRLINMIVGTIADVIREGFQEFSDHQITIINTETNPAHFSAYADSDVLMIRPFRVEFSGMGGVIQLIMPGSVVDAIFRHKKSRLTELGISARNALASHVRDFEMTVTGELQGAQLTLREVLELGTGDIVPIEAPDQVDVKVNRIPKFKARMGEINGRIGLEILRYSQSSGGFRKVSTSDTGQTQDPEVLAQAFPQLGGNASTNRGHKGGSGEARLQAVPAPPASAPGSGTTLPVPSQAPTSALDRFWNVPVSMTFEVGRENITVQHLMTLSRGSIVPLKNVYVDSVKVKVGERTIARGEAISLKNHIGIRINEVVVPPGTGGARSR